MLTLQDIKVSSGISHSCQSDLKNKVLLEFWQINICAGSVSFHFPFTSNVLSHCVAKAIWKVLPVFLYVPTVLSTKATFLRYQWINWGKNASLRTGRAEWCRWVISAPDHGMNKSARHFHQRSKQKFSLLSDSTLLRNISRFIKVIYRNYFEAINIKLYRNIIFCLFTWFRSTIYFLYYSFCVLLTNLDNCFHK